MGVDDDVDVVGRPAGLGQEAFGKRTPAVDGVHGGVFFRPFFADAGFDDDLLLARVDEQAIHVHTNAVCVIRRRNPLPQHLWHNAEHRSAIEPKLGVGYYLNSQISKLHRQNNNGQPFDQLSVVIKESYFF